MWQVRQVGEREGDIIAGTVSGGKLAAKKNKALYGKDFYARIGRAGGRAGKGVGYQGGFASEAVGVGGMDGRTRASVFGRVGGRKSRRGPSKKTLGSAKAQQHQAKLVTTATGEQKVSAQRGAKGFGRFWAGFRRTRGGERGKV